MSDTKGLLKHGRNYLIANVASKALAFVSIPVYTRIMSVEEYGVVGVFMSVIGIATVLLTLNSEVSISRYYYDAKDETDFKQFVGTSINLSLLILLIMTIIFLSLSSFVASSLSFPILLTFCIIPVSLYNITNSIFVQIYNPQMQSKKIAIVSSVQSYLAFGLSVVCILLLHNEKYYGYVLGNIFAMIILASYITRQIRPYYIGTFKKKYIKYIVNYCLPYMPYTLSGVILSQFSRIVIGNSQGYTLAGSYTLATNIAALMIMLISVTHSAWNPYYFNYMNKKDYNSIDHDYNLIWRMTLLVAVVIAVFGYELGYLLSKGGDYLTTLYVIPILVVGYCFYQWSYVYLRNTGYAKRTIWNAYCVLASGVINIGLNILLVPRFNELGAAIATSISFIILMFLSYLSNRYIIKEYTPQIFIFIRLFVLCLPLFAACGLINVWAVTNIWYLIVVKSFIIVIAVIVLCRPFWGRLRSVFLKS